YTLSLHDALPISRPHARGEQGVPFRSPRRHPAESHGSGPGLPPLSRAAFPTTPAGFESQSRRAPGLLLPVGSILMLPASRAASSACPVGDRKCPAGMPNNPYGVTTWATTKATSET